MLIPRPSCFKTNELQRSKHLFLEKQKNIWTHKTSSCCCSFHPAHCIVTNLNQAPRTGPKKFSRPNNLLLLVSLFCFSMLFASSSSINLAHPITPNPNYSLLLSLAAAINNTITTTARPPARLSYPFLQKLPKP